MSGFQFFIETNIFKDVVNETVMTKFQIMKVGENKFLYSLVIMFFLIPVQKNSGSATGAYRVHNTTI